MTKRSYTRSPEMRKRSSDSMKEKWKDPSYREGNPTNSGNFHSQKTKDAMSAVRVGRSYHTEAQLEATREANRARKGVWHNPNPPTTKGKKIHSAENKRRAGLLLHEPENERKAIEASRKATASPNGCEMALGEILNEIGFGDWRFVGTGQLMIGNKNPDFWDGDDRIIELFGDYWHRGDSGEERIAYFAEHGFETLIVWESELSDKASLISRIHTWLW